MGFMKAILAIFLIVGIMDYRSKYLKLLERATHETHISFNAFV